MDRGRTEKFLSPNLEPESLQRQIIRFRQSRNHLKQCL